MRIGAIHLNLVLQSFATVTKYTSPPPYKLALWQQSWLGIIIGVYAHQKAHGAGSAPVQTPSLDSALRRVLTTMVNSKPNLEKAASRSPSELFGAWPPNWLHGKPIKLNPLLLYFCKADALSVSGDCFTGCCQICKLSVEKIYFMCHTLPGFLMESPRQSSIGCMAYIIQRPQSSVIPIG